MNASGWIDHRPTVPPVQIELSGLPHAVQCPSWYFPHSCPFWIGSGAGGDVVELPDGSALITTVVTYLSGHTLNPPEACGVFIFRSTDKPRWGRWRYLGTVATAAQFPQNGEGPNENAITLLADGKTLSVVFRLDSESPQPPPLPDLSLMVTAFGGWQTGTACLCTRSRPSRPPTIRASPPTVRARPPFSLVPLRSGQLPSMR